jgi:hypothetical protein
VVAVIIVALLVGFAEGSMTVIVPAFASGHHQAAAAGPLLSAMSTGSLGHGMIGFGVLLALVGITLVPTLTTGFVATQQVAPPAALAEAFTWTSFCASAGPAAPRRWPAT